MDNNEILEEQENLLTLTDENGNDVTFEYLDVIEYQGKDKQTCTDTNEGVSAVEYRIPYTAEVDEINDLTHTRLGINVKSNAKTVYHITDTARYDKRKSNAVKGVFCVTEIKINEKRADGN